MSVLLPVSIFPETLPARELLTHLTTNHRSVAIVVDEYGTTSGMVTIEDIIEEILVKLMMSMTLMFIWNRKFLKQNFYLPDALRLTI